MARDAEKPAKKVTAESLWADLDEAEKALLWMDRLRWVAALLPLGMALLFIGWSVFGGNNAPFPPDAQWALRIWPLIVGVAAGVLCWLAFTWMSRHFRRSIAKARADLLEKVPGLRARVESAETTKKA